MSSPVKFGFQIGTSELFSHQYMQENQLCKKNRFARKSVSHGRSYCWDGKQFTVAGFGLGLETTGEEFSLKRTSSSTARREISLQKMV